MEPIFTLPYSEYEVIRLIQTKLKKKDGFSCFIPASRQQKGIDFILYNSKTKKTIGIQVKSSRSYQDLPKKLKNGKLKEVKYHYNLWFNNFIDRYKEGSADWYILFGVYPTYESNQKIKSKKLWRPIILCIKDDMMLNILRKVKTKKENKPDKFFGFGFNDNNKIFATRGFHEQINVSEYLLENQINNIKKGLG